jgi:hypothetical protein
LQVVTARNAAEAAEAVGPGMRLMLVADGFVGDRAHIDRLMGANRPVLLAVTDRGFDDRFERIDGDMRWAGLALVDADLLRDAASMPDDWDVQSTLLRRALQTGVKPLPLVDEREAAELGIVERRQDFAELQRRILAGAATGPRNWFSRTILAPIERLATGSIMTSPLTPTMIGTAGTVLMGPGAARLRLRLPLARAPAAAARFAAGRDRDPIVPPAAPAAASQCLVAGTYPDLGGRSAGGARRIIGARTWVGHDPAGLSRRRFPHRAPARGSGEAGAWRRIPRRFAEPDGADDTVRGGGLVGSRAGCPVRLCRWLLLLGAISRAPQSRISCGLTLSC